MARAKDWVPAGAPDHWKGRDRFFPPAPGMTYFWGIFSPSAKAEDLSSMAFPPWTEAAIIRATINANRQLLSRDRIPASPLIRFDLLTKDLKLIEKSFLVMPNGLKDQLGVASP